MKTKIKYAIAILTLLLILIITYSTKINNYSISIDNEIFINNPQEMIKGWFSIGRYSLGFYKYIFHNYNLNITQTNILSLLILLIALLIFSYDLAKRLNKERIMWNMLLVVGFTLTAPVLTEQFIFTMQILEISISYLLFVIAFLWINQVIYNKKYRLIPCIIPLLLLIFGTYQAFYLLFITFSAIYYIIYNKNKKYLLKQQIIIIIKYIAFLIIGMIGTQIINYLVCSHFQIENTNYLKNQIYWLSKPMKFCLIRIGKYAVNIIMGKPPFFNLSFLIGIILWLKYIRNEWKLQKSVLALITNLFILIAPCIFAIAFGNETINRVQLSLPVVVAFIYVLSLETNKKIFYTIPLIFILLQSITCHFLYQSDLARYKRDLQLAHQIERIMEKNTGKFSTIVYIGISKNDSKLQGETIGKSFFNWDRETEQGANNRIFWFMKTVGINYQAPTIEQIKEVKEKEASFSQQITFYKDILVYNLSYQ